MSASTTSERRGIFTPIDSFAVTLDGVPVVMRPGDLVDDRDPLYQRHKDKFREPRVRKYASKGM